MDDAKMNGFIHSKDQSVRACVQNSLQRLHVAPQSLFWTTHFCANKKCADISFQNCDITMTEVRSTQSGGLGLFANQDYNVGDVILQEKSPLIVLSAPSEAASLLKVNASKKGKRKSGATPPSLLESITPPSSIPSHQADNFRGMIQAAVSFAEQQPSQEVKQELLQLYHPVDGDDTTSSPLEVEILEVSEKALTYLQKNAIKSLSTLVSENPQDVKNIMLVWASNSFQGGRIYSQQSRINHSCNPNAVVQTIPGYNYNDGQCIRAAAPIKAGQEVFISYLGLFLYADGPTRRQELARSKHFQCACQRCLSAPDVAAAIPCPSCHKRSGRYLDEDTQYDDEGTVHYAIPASSLDTNSVECPHCHETTTLSQSDAKKPNHPLNLSKTVSTKVATHLQKQQQSTTDDDEELQQEWQEQLLQLSSSVLGARHWATNLLILLRLDQSLKSLSSTMITTGNPPELLEVAELVDHVERLVTFVNGLNLELHMGHLLGNVVIGIARMLVTMGDAKSKKFASEWLSKIQDDYVAHFESDEMKKVVETLAVAWEKGDDQEMEFESNKRAKIS